MKKINIDTLAIKQMVANFLVPLISLGLVTAIGFLVLYPTISNRPMYEEKLEASRALDEQLLTKLEKLNYLVDYKSAVDENNSLLSDVLAQKPLVPELLTQLDIIAKEAGLGVEKLSYSFGAGKDTAEGTLTDINVNMGIIGTYDQLVAFFRALEKAGRLVNVDNYRYTLTEDNALSINLTFSSPYVDVKTDAVTDDPIAFDISDTKFVSLMSSLKEFKVYRISVDDYIEVPATPEIPTQQGEQPLDAPAEVGVLQQPGGAEAPAQVPVVPTEEPLN
ncbi:type 4a pilus biogenesis protein PilO [Candidatus Nomurabacteria bacterium]|uniref:Type 4a pilus biogenesis protein PilO n=1 Tax=candidate division WWE3 bacterium TaxID=2053526 RepID=A0A955E0K3_UNCKA|nr:type 4a pilus biogenesis protein PilO [candidate division WWE3 bacterium]MCB9823727.1 type 4a pilus biogenesis protein PilO [Candidatus Nomurabacteria bacterium]MCB9827194.1 type 4a pilus biogenesis protein PilO [Candidatus Nomurabacteria bacterium]MCB9827522.1 type 4a pilus biogenesis protein PilO [Candidatus Nomurabacteria bacterium]HXK52917.1 type 4a pilus biogenesis protein PilO [bacterium]